MRTERLDPSLATTAFIKDDREGKVFVDSTRVGGATVVAAYSPRVRPGAPVSFPLAWDELDDVQPSDFTVHTAPDALGDGDPWAEHMPAPQHLAADLIAEGHEIPVARVQAMHEGKRRKRARAETQAALEVRPVGRRPESGYCAECREPFLKPWPSPLPASSRVPSTRATAAPRSSTPCCRRS